MEIDCPDDCPHLAAAREHPAAPVKRQQEQDLAVVLPSIRHLTERQRQLYLLLYSAVVQHRPQGLARLLDEDVEQAAAAVAATLETAAKGVIYQHTASSLPAQRLAAEMTALLEQTRARGARVSDTEAAIALRAIEQGARDARKAPGGTDTSYISLMARLLQVRPGRGSGQSEPAKPESPLIVP